MDSDSEWNLFTLISQLVLELRSTKWGLDGESKLMPLVIQIISLVRSMDLDSQPKPQSKLMSLVTQTVSLFNSTDLDSLPSPLLKLISLISKKVSIDSDEKPESDFNFSPLLEETRNLKPYPELISLIFLIFSIVISTNAELEELTSLFGQVEGHFDEGKFHVTHDGSWDLESMLISLISEIMDLDQSTDPEWERKITSIIIRIIGLFKSRDLDLQPKPQSKLMSLVNQTVSRFNSTDLDSLPGPLSKLISLISQKVSIDSDQKPESDLKLSLLVEETLELKPDPELISLIRQIFSHVTSIKYQILGLVLLVPQVQVSFHEGKFRVEPLKRSDTWKCFVGNWILIPLTRETYLTDFCYRSGNGENHNEYEKVPVKIKHPLHQKHSLQLAFNTSIPWGGHSGGTRECYCCNEVLVTVFYFCSACDFALNIACVEKPLLLSIPLSKWHDHPLYLFPRKTSLTCDICALATSNSPFYICPPCDFVAHLKCINLPCVIRISRHPHRICHTPSFEEGDWSCGVCRRKIDNDYGCYSCVKDGCSYAAHSRCATQSNIWDGIDLDGEPEEIEEDVAEPFVTISVGIIQHFSHDHHHLRLDMNTCRDYNENKLCQACLTPIYFGNLYSCVQCEFILHESCAHLSRKIYNPTHPHLLILAAVRDVMDFEVKCAACDRTLSRAGFFYECGKEECHFRLHVQCATISEPLVHANHVHPLFLTSKPGEKRNCSVCQRGRFCGSMETFNCIDECNDFALCFTCATLPQKLRYTHDKHILALSYGEETDTVTYWCEACEREINPRNGLYTCDEYCCVTLHIACLIGKDLYMKPGSSFIYTTIYGTFEQVGVQSNNHHISRPICSTCKKRCPHKIIFQCFGSMFCSLDCLNHFIY